MDQLILQIDCFAGPKAAIYFSWSSRYLCSQSPLDRQGLTTDYILAVPCPSPNDGIQERILWDALDDEDAIQMPSLDAEIVFLMLRPSTPRHVVERMLFFSVRAGRPCIVLEIIQRLYPLAHTMGRVLMMVLLDIPTFVDTVCNGLNNGGNVCCQILLHRGAAVSQEDAVFIRYSERSYHRQIVVSRRFCYRDPGGADDRHWVYQLPPFWGASQPKCFDIAWNRWHQESYGPDVFPIHTSHIHGAYRGYDDFIDRRDGVDGAEDAQWVWFDDGGFETEFYSSMSSPTPPQGSWTRLPDAARPEGSTCIVSCIDTATLADAYAAVEGSLLSAAETERSEWLKRGWDFRTSSRTEQLMEVLQSCGQWIQ